MIKLKTNDRKNPLDGFRNEVKVPLDREQFESFLPRLNNLGLFQSIPYPDRKINSVYFDTTDFADYVDNISGASSRRKTRVRWYKNDLSKLTLEQKIKNNKASRKESTRLSNVSKIYPNRAENIREILVNNGNVEAKVILGTVRPVLEVQYDRKYYKLAPALRMTIDCQQKFKRLYPSPVPYFINSPVYAVVEFKYDATKQAQMKSILKNIPNRIFRHSKYVIGMDCTARQ